MPKSKSDLNEPLTVESLKRELHAALDTYHKVATRDLNDRFTHFEKRQEQQHQEIMSGFAEVISTVNDHVDERFEHLEKSLAPDQLGRTLPERFDELATRTGHPDLTSPAAQGAG